MLHNKRKNPPYIQDHDDMQIFEIAITERKALKPKIHWKRKDIPFKLIPIIQMKFIKSQSILSFY